MEMLTDEDRAALSRRLVPRGRPVKYEIDHLPEWGVFVVPAYLEGAALLSAVKSVQAAGKRRGWNMVRTATHRLVRVGKGQMPVSVGEAF